MPHNLHLFYAFVYSVVATNIEKIVAYSVWLVSFDNLYRNIHQLDLEWYTCIFSFRYNPKRVTQHCDMFRCQVLDVYE